MSLPSGQVEDLANGLRERSPRRCFRLELSASGARQLVVLRVAVVVRRRPLRLDPPATFQTVERRIQRPLLHVDDASRDLLEPFRNGPTMLRFQGQDFQNEQVERSLRQTNSFVRHAIPLSLRQESMAFLTKCKGKSSIESL